MKEANIHSNTIIHKAWNQAKVRFEHTFDFAFRTKEQYLEFRRCWKENYAALSESIRGSKALIKATMRKREYAGKHQSELRPLKAEATVQLSMLRSAKQEANRQYVAARQVTS
jgi:hypothetical protein